MASCVAVASLTTNSPPSPSLLRKKKEKQYITLLVNNLSRLSVLKGVRKFCTCFLWCFAQSLMDTTKDEYRLRAPSLHSISCAFSALNHGFCSSVRRFYHLLHFVFQMFMRMRTEEFDWWCGGFLFPPPPLALVCRGD